MKRLFIISFLVLLAMVITFPAESSASLVSGADWNIVGTGDFNLDGNPDILWRNQTTGQVVAWYMANGNVLAEQVILTVPDPNMIIVAIADFAGYGVSDILWQNTFTGELIVYTMNGWIKSGEFTIATGIAASLRVVGAGDFNGDGVADILWRDTQTGDVSVWFMNGSSPPASTGSQSIATVDPIWQIAGVGDFNGDAMSDILWRNSSTGDGAVWFMNGTTLIGNSNSFTVPTSWSIVGVFDANADGVADILWRAPSNGDIAVWLMDSTATLIGVQHYSDAYDPNWVILGTGDFNGDGTQDILWLNRSTNEMVIWFMTGSTLAYSMPVGVVPGGEWEVEGIGDFNGDGFADILWRLTTTGSLYVWYMDEATYLGNDYIETVPPEWKIAAVGDFNGDGQSDLIWLNQNIGMVAYWFMNGVTISSTGIIYPDVDMTWRIVGLADFNGDGVPDLVWLNSRNGNVGYWYMNSDGTISSIAQININVPSVWSIVGVGDYNEDGLPDLLWRDSTCGLLGFWYMGDTTLISTESLWAQPNDQPSVLAGSISRASLVKSPAAKSR